MTTHRSRRQKGRAFEYGVARRLSLWWTDDATDEAFTPSRGSGASRRMKHQRGDIAPVSNDAEILTSQFCFECKCVKSIAWAGVLYGTQSTDLLKYYGQALEAASSIGARPIVVFKENTRFPMFWWSAATRKHWFDLYLAKRRTPSFVFRVGNMYGDDMDRVLRFSDANNLIQLEQPNVVHRLSRHPSEQSSRS